MTVRRCYHGDVASSCIRPECTLIELRAQVADLQAERDSLREHDHICGEILTANEDLGEALTVALADVDRLRGLCREQSEWLSCTLRMTPGDADCGACLPCRIRAEATR